MSALAFTFDLYWHSAIVEYCNLRSHQHQDGFDEKTTKEIEQKIIEMHGKGPKSEEKKRDDEATWWKQLRDTLAHRQLITVFDFRQEEETGEALDGAILNALFKARALEQRAEESGKGELQLALAWNRFDMAQATIFDTKRTGALKCDIWILQYYIEFIQEGGL